MTRSQNRSGKITRNYRWRICALLFAGTTLNYLDRQVIGILAPFLQDKFGWSEIDYGTIVTAFQAAYVIGLFFSGQILDRIGTRIGYAIAVGGWSIAGMLHALGGSVASFAAARFALGLGEAANFPAVIKTTAEWFPVKERAFAIGVANSGSNIGAVLAPVLVPFIALTFGWQWAFISTGAVGLLWVVIWLKVMRTVNGKPDVSEQELEIILADDEPETERPSLSSLIVKREVWAICIALFLTGPVWWFFLFWLPKFLSSTHGVTLTGLAAPLVTIYLISDLGSILGGWASSSLINRGWSVDSARTIVLITAAICVTPVVFASMAPFWVSVGLVSLAAACHQAWAANIFAVVTDMFPKHAVATVISLGIMCAAIGGMFVASTVGFILERTGSYLGPFLMAASAYLIAFAAFRLLVPNIRPISNQEQTV